MGGIYHRTYGLYIAIVQTSSNVLILGGDLVYRRFKRDPDPAAHRKRGVGGLAIPKPFDDFGGEFDQKRLLAVGAGRAARAFT